MLIYYADALSRTGQITFEKQFLNQLQQEEILKMLIRLSFIVMCN